MKKIENVLASLVLVLGGSGREQQDSLVHFARVALKRPTSDAPIHTCCTAVLCEVQVDQRERNFKVLAFVASILAAACALVRVRAVAGANQRTISGHVLDTVVLALIAVVAEEMAVEVRDRVTMTASNLPILLAIMFLGPMPAMAVAAVVGLWGAWRETSRAVVVYNCSQLIISAFVAAEAFALLQQHLAIPLGSVSVLLLCAGAMGAVLYEATTTCSSALARAYEVRHFAGNFLARRHAVAVVQVIGLRRWPGACDGGAVCDCRT